MRSRLQERSLIRRTGGFGLAFDNFDARAIAQSVPGQPLAARLFLAATAIGLVWLAIARRCPA